MKTKPSSRLNRLICALLCLVVLFAAPAHRAYAAGNRYYVRGNGGSDSNNGTSWAQAFKNLQKALTTASSGDEIWVAAAVYYPDNGGPYPLDSRDAKFILINNLKVYGGFAGTESDLSQRNLDANPTILSGDVDNNDVNTDGDFIANTVNDLVGANAYHVVVASGTSSTAVLDGFIITAGQADSNNASDGRGAGLYSYNGSPTLRNLTFQGNSALLGGGIYSQDSQLTASNIRFINNDAQNAGGGWWNQGESSLAGGLFSGNRAGTAGGGMMVQGTPTQGGPSLVNVTFTANLASNGAGLANDGSNLSLSKTNFGINAATVRGGGIDSQGAGSPTLSEVSFNSNSAANGGGIATSAGSNPSLTLVDFNANQAGFGAGMQNDGTSPTLFSSTFNANIATNGGGGMMNINGAAPSIEMTTFSGNQADTGGGMYDYNSNPVIKNVDFLNNIATSSATGGGGMFNYTSSPSLRRVKFIGNQANSGAGGGIYNYLSSSPAITDASFSGNSALNGGAIRNHFNNQSVLTNVTFAGNEAQYGGAVSNDTSTPAFYNVTFANNFANQGGGMNNYQSSPSLWNVTFFGNAAQGVDQGGGMYNSTSSAPFLRNVILAGSTNGDCVNGAGGAITGWYSLIQDTGVRACGAVNGNQGFKVGVNPLLGVLANNGGFGQTFEPGAGSPAIDAVIDNTCMTQLDQRGFSRFLDGDRNGSTICDMGAVEAGSRVFLPLIKR